MVQHNQTTRIQKLALKVLKELKKTYQNYFLALCTKLMKTPVVVILRFITNRYYNYIINNNQHQFQIMADAQIILEIIEQIANTRYVTVYC